MTRLDSCDVNDLKLMSLKSCKREKENNANKVIILYSVLLLNYVTIRILFDTTF